MEGLHIDGDFPTGKECEHHCSPSCHPAQVGPELVYGCTHPAWPQNRAGDFVPIVDCGGVPSKCDLCKQTKHIGRYIGGMKRRVSSAEAKADKYRLALMDAVSLSRKAGTSNQGLTGRRMNKRKRSKEHERRNQP